MNVQQPSHQYPPFYPPNHARPAHDFPMPAIPSHFPELERLSLKALQELSDQPDKLDEFFYDLDIIKTPIQIRDDLLKSNREQALTNLSHESEFKQLGQEIEELREEAIVEYDQLVEAEKERKALLDRYSDENVLKQVKLEIQQVDEESEEMAEAFLSNDMLDEREAECYFQEYLRKRESYHLKASKVSVFSNSKASLHGC